jgi:hypothetical protein
MVLDQLFLWHLGAILVIFASTCWVKHKVCRPLENGQQSILGIATRFVATLFAFILGFTVAILWKDYREADKRVVNEATELRIICSLSRAVEQSQTLRDRVLAYTQAVIEEEWPAMTKGQTSPKADQARNRLWVESLALAKKYPQQKSFTEAILKALVQFDHDRRERMALLEKSVHPLIYYTLILSGISTIICFTFLSVRRTQLQYLLDAIIVSAVVFNIYLVSAIDLPFSGTGITVSPKPFLNLQQQLAAEIREAEPAPAERK